MNIPPIAAKSPNLKFSVGLIIRVLYKKSNVQNIPAVIKIAWKTIPLYIAEKNAEIFLEAKDLLIKWENRDPEVRKLWKLINELRLCVKNSDFKEKFNGSFYPKVFFNSKIN